MKVSIKKATEELGCAQETLRRLERLGKIKPERTLKGHRRYDLAKLRGILPFKKIGSKLTIAYARVSSHDQKSDLKRQVAVLESFCSKQGWCFEVMQDLGSGLNYNKKGLRKLIKELCSGSVERLVITHKDRLLRFGSELIFSICEQFCTEVVIINASAEANFEDDLVQDVLESVTVFSARLYGSRSRKSYKILEALKDAANQI